MKFAVFTVSTPDYSLEETAIKLKELGYDGVEWRVAQGMTKKPDPLPARESWYWTYNRSTVDLDTIEQSTGELQALSERYKLPIVCLSTYLKPDQQTPINRVLRAASELGVPRVRIQAPNYDGSKNYNDLYNETKANLTAIQPLAKRYGVKLCLEIHHKTIIPSASAAYRLVSALDSQLVGIIHDAGNMVHEGYEAYRMGLEILGPYLDHVHIKNANWRWNQQNSTWQCFWSPLRQGQVDLLQLIRELTRIGYDSYLSCEDFSNEHSQEEKLRDNLIYLKDLVKQASS